MTAKSFSDVVGRQIRTSVGKADSRRKLIGAVRAAAARMALTDDDRHVLQLELVGKASLSDMTLAEIGKVLDRLNRDRPAPMAHRAHVGKIRALWWTCYWLGEIDEPNDDALDAFVRRQTRLSSLRFVDHRAAPAIIEALKAMAARAGVVWMSPKALAELAAHHERKGTGSDRFTQGAADRWAVIDALWGKLADLGQVRRDVGPEMYLLAAIGDGVMDRWGWSAHQGDAAIRALGKKWRRAVDAKKKAAQ